MIRSRHNRQALTARILRLIAERPDLRKGSDIAREMRLSGDERRLLREILNARTSEQGAGDGDRGDVAAGGAAATRSAAFPSADARHAAPAPGHLRMPGEARDDLSILGLFRRNSHGGAVQPADRRDRREFLIRERDRLGARDGDVVRVRERPSRGRGPVFGEVTGILGRFEDPGMASLLAMHQNGISEAFPPEVLEEAASCRLSAVPREDLRGLPLVTIDPDDARDHDDAVFAEREGSGWRVIVAIADVAAYVATGSHLDREALRRGNSAYFPDRVSPMLPETLSADLCSLREGADRPALAVDMRFADDGTKTDHRIFRALIRSSARLTYTQAQQAINGAPDATTRALLEEALVPLWEVYGAISRLRALRAPLDLNIPERRISLDPSGRVASIGFRDRLDAHRVIEELMIQANISAAETLEAHDISCLYRVHDPPSGEKITALGKFLPSVGIDWRTDQTATSERFNRLLLNAKGSAHEDVVQEMVLRTQAQARYTPENAGHFGLNLRSYSHFTSPIRRYADLVTHRLLIQALGMGSESSPVDAETLGDIASHLTATERRAMAAERQAGERYVAAFMSDRKGERFAGRIAGVSRSGLFIRLDETGADGFVPVSTLEGDFWVHDEEQASLVGRRRMQRYDMGMPVEVTLIEAAPLTGGLLLRMATPPRRPRKGRTAEAGPAAPRAGPKRPSDGRRPDRGEVREHGKHGVRRHAGGRKKSR